MSPRKTPGRPRQVPDELGRRYYHTGDGRRLLSVTTALGIAINKPALPGWAAKRVAESAMSNLPRLIRMSRTEKDDAVRWLKGRPYAERDDAAAAGTAAHALAEARVLGAPFAPPDLGSAAAKTLGQFERFLSDWTPEYEATEATVANLTHGYAGTLDAICRLPALQNGAPMVLDYKTSRTGPYPEWALQLAAYRHAECLWLPGGEPVDMPAVDECAVLRLRPGFYALHLMSADDDAAFAAFLAALDVARWAIDAEAKEKEFKVWGAALPTPGLEVSGADRDVAAAGG